MNYLQCLRQQNGLKQHELAAALGISQTLLSLIERGWYARAPRGVEEGLQTIFGSQWTFDQLVKPMRDLVEPPGHEQNDPSGRNRPVNYRR
jgi:transcriptional regulator with XRE-family HTH domain